VIRRGWKLKPNQAAHPAAQGIHRLLQWQKSLDAGWPWC
jgi:hypothetical protein